MSEDPKRPIEEDDDQTISLSGAEVATNDVDRAPRTTLDPPVIVAGYRILNQLGRGGTGVVWEAEQEHPKRRVALKVLRRDHLIDEYHTKMFQREVETLARLKHPNIAAIYESGHTEDGHDYFAMELVQGQTLDRWLEARPGTLDPDEIRLRLHLFQTMCDAVHYAHQRGVIHRDLKPANIIVTSETSSLTTATSGTARPSLKILDFGLARITDSDVAVTQMSEIGTIKGTLQYMSPEQARGDMDAIDTRTDVYALGVILYEMLAGILPYEVSPAAIAEAIRVICEDPPKPLRSSFQGARRLDVDLETIVGKALEKEADRRYASASAMAEDVERHLESQPIMARPPTAMYQMRMFARRNRTLVGSATVALLMLVIFAAAMAVQSERIRREAERANREAATARAVSEFLIGLFDRSDPTLAQGEEPTAREILDNGAHRIEELDDQPQTQAAFMETMGRVFMSLGEYDRAGPLIEGAVDSRARFSDHDESALAAALYHQATLLDLQGRYDEAEPPARRSVEIRERELGDHPDLGFSLNTLGNILWHQGRLDEAEAVHRRALDLRERILPANHSDIGQSVHNIGALRYFAGDLAGAERLWRRSAEIEEANHGPNDWNLATSLHTLAIVCSDQDRFDEALALEQRSLAIREDVLGPDHPHVALSLTTLGNIYREMGRSAEAEPLIRRAIIIAETTWGPTHGEVFWMRRSLARALIDLESFAVAQEELDDLLQAVERAGARDDVPPVLAHLGELYTRRGEYDRAEAYYLEGIELLRGESENDGAVGLATANLARMYREAGRRDEAESAYRRALELMQPEWGSSDPDVRKADEELQELISERSPE